MVHEATTLKGKKQGIIFGLIAYTLWGLLPLYWDLLEAVPAHIVLGHRILWSCVFVGVLVFVWGSWKGVGAVFQSRKNFIITLITAVVISGNWLTYIYAVHVGRVIETSMGYYINPLVTILLSVIILKEQLSPLKWVAVGIAAVGVGTFTLWFGALPWIPLTLAFTFAFYGLMKKMLPADSISGLFVETVILAPIVLVYLGSIEYQGTGVIGNVPPITLVLLSGAGVATATPLLFFSMAAQRIKLNIVGFMQYLAPTLALILGVFFFREPFKPVHMFTFSCIWVALAIYTSELLREFRRERRKRAAAHLAEKESVDRATGN